MSLFSETVPRTKGNLYVAFLQMGQGDCTVIICPNNKIVMIDCGSVTLENSTSMEDLKALLDTDVFQSSRQIDALVLTHPDEDHYNRVVPLLVDEKIQVDRVYYSSTIDQYNKSKVQKGTPSAWLEKKLIIQRAVTLNLSTASPGSIEATINGQPPAGNVVDLLDPQGRIKILDGTAVLRNKRGPECGVYILASGVVPYPNAVDEKSSGAKKQKKGFDSNCGSIVTVVEFMNQRILICGDATFDTERFLVEKQSANIKNLFALQIPHHGSEETSGSEAFVKCVNPTTAVISAKPTAELYHFPRKSVVDLYAAGTNLIDEMEEHPLDQWREVEGDADAQEGGSNKRVLTPWKEFKRETPNTSRSIFCTGSNGHRLLTVPAQ